jgi:MauM/NapG family ferredoxin protein
MAMEKWWMLGIGAAAYYLLQMAKGSGPTYIRPPGAIPEEAFLAVCLRCGICVQACPHNAIEILGAAAGVSIGTPALANLRKRPCWLCMNCGKVCPSKALENISKEEVRIGLAYIDRERCLSWLGDECKICYVMCPIYNEALVLEGFLKTGVRADKCTGCGVCEHVCVLQTPAIKVLPRYGR